MNQSRRFFRKTTAAALGISLIVSGCSTVFAATSYKEAEKEALNTLTKALPESWDEYLSQYEKGVNGSQCNITLKVEDTGRALVGALMGGTDVSWLQNIRLDSNVSIKDGVEAVVSSVLLNDSQICDFNVYVDLANLMQYIQIPELSEAYITAPISSGTEDTSAEAQEFLSTYMTALSDISSMLPDSKTVTTLLDRYGNLIIDNVEEGASVEESLSVDGISESCTAYEGLISEKALTAMTENILTSAKDDAEIKGLFEQWSDPSDGEKQYQEFQTAIESTLGSIHADGSASEEALLSSKIWVNTEGRIVGRQIGVEDEETNDIVPIFTWKAPSSNDTSALFIDISADGSSLTLTGSGKTADDLLNGNYVLAVDGTETVDINVENLETKPEKPGYYNGTFNLTFPTSSETASNETTESAANPLAGFGAVLKLTSDASSETSSLDLTVTTSGAALATLSITGEYSDGVEIPDLASLDKTYDASSDEAMTEYLTDVNWDTFISNAKVAGLPDELASQLEAVLKSAVENATQPIEEENTTAEDNAA